MRSLLLLAFAASLTLAGETTPHQIGTPREIIAADYQKKTLKRISPAGEVLYETPIRSIHDLQLLANGHLLYQTSFQNVIEIDADGKEVWRYDVPEARRRGPNRIEIHAFQRLPGGNTMIAESGSRRIVEVDEEGKIVVEVPLTVDNPHPHRDTRLVRKTAKGTYLVAHEGDAKVREYDADGKVLWTHDVGTKVYSATRLANGNTLLGTGDGHAVREVNADGKTVWELTSDDLPGIELVWITMAERMADGNTFVVNCHAGPKNPQLLIVTPEKKIAWSYKDFDRFGNSLPVGLVVPEEKPDAQRNVNGIGDPQ